MEPITRTLARGTPVPLAGLLLNHMKPLEKELRDWLKATVNEKRDTFVSVMIVMSRTGKPYYRMFVGNVHLNAKSLSTLAKQYRKWKGVK